MGKNRTRTGKEKRIIEEMTRGKRNEDHTQIKCEGKRKNREKKSENKIKYLKKRREEKPKREREKKAKEPDHGGNTGTYRPVLTPHRHPQPPFPTPPHPPQ